MTSAERDAQIAEDYKSLSASRVAAKYNLSIPQVRRIAKAAGIEKGPATLVLLESKVIDEDHRVLGLKLYFFRQKAGQDTLAGAEALGGWSIRKLRSIEQGLTVLNLMDLKAIANYMGIPLTKLIENI